jgi:hypothetical protein
MERLGAARRRIDPRTHNNTMKRPVSLSILGWFIVVTNAIALLVWPWTLHNPSAQAVFARSMMPLPVMLAVSIASQALCLVAGVGILKGRAWARTLYTVITLATLAFSLVTSPFKIMLLPGAVLAALFLYLLYRPAATAYFVRDAR